MIRTLFAALLATASISVALVETAHAQPAEAIGHPLPAQDLPTGTITVRVIAGSMSAAVTESAVTLTVNGTPREARTDATGRATFAGLPAGAKVKATVLDAEQKEVASDEFPVPGAGGVKIMLSTKPFVGGAGMPAMQGGGGMPEARVISGEPRPDGTNQPGSYSVRLTYNNLKMGKTGPDDDAPPVGEPVHLASYKWDGTIKVQTSKTDAKGNATFANLDQSGGTTYFAFGALRRGDKLDRMIAKPMTLDTQNGVRVVLSALKRDATDPGVDDYDQFTAMKNTTPAGKVRVMLAGAPQAGEVVELYDLESGQKVGSAPVIPGPPDEANVEAGGGPTPTKEAPGTIEVSLVGGAGQKQDPMTGVLISFIDGATDDTITTMGITGPDGKVKVTVPATMTNGVKVAFHFGLPPISADTDLGTLKDVGGTTITSEALDVSKNGVLLAVEAHWPESSGFEATLDMPIGKLLYAQVTQDTKTGPEKFRSRPFESFADAGVLEKINVWKRTPQVFDAIAFVDDQQLVIQGQYAVQNWGWEPVRSGTDGLVIPFPSNMRHPVVAAKDQNVAAVAPGEGYRILRPIPPGGVAFGFGFDVAIDGGSSTVAFPSKFGTMGARFRVRQNPGQVVTTPPGQKGALNPGPEWYAIQNIVINPGQEFSVTVSGLPANPAWKIWMPRILGIVVLILLLGGIAYALSQSPAEATPGDAKRREKLLEELVALEKRGNLNAKERKEREKLIDELERIWGN